MGKVLRTFHVGSDVTAPTLFCQSWFVAAVTRSQINHYEPLDLGAGVHCVQSRGRWGSRKVYLSPLGLYCCPTTNRVVDVISRLRTVTTESYRWVVRFDHDFLARQLSSLNIPSVTSSTHVISIRGNHESLFAKFSETRRRQVRRAARDGVVVRRASTHADIQAYYTIHRELSDQKDRAEDYPLRLFVELATLDETHLLLAEHQGQVIGGAVFFVDGDSLFYWHGASSRAHAGVFPTCAIFDHAIRMATENRLATVNLGASLGVSSLEQFKASWGASPLNYWKFEWKNPLWTTLKRVRIRSQWVIDAVRRRSRDA